MTRDEIRELFRDYVFGFIQSDIEREIWLARKAEHDEAHGTYPGPHPGGGNVLAALGLLCYTEFLGSLEAGPDAPNERKFTTFLHRMERFYASDNNWQPPGKAEILFGKLSYLNLPMDEEVDVFLGRKVAPLRSVWIVEIAPDGVRARTLDELN